MLSLSVTAFGIIFIIQTVEGGWIQQQIELQTIEPIIQPLREATEAINKNIALLETKKQELIANKTQLAEKISKIPKECQTDNLKFSFHFFDKWDLDACVNLTDDWKYAADLTLQGGTYMLNLTEIIGGIGEEILDCPQKHFTDVLPCYNKNLKELKKEVDRFKSETVPFVHEALEISKSMKKDFDKCVGIPSVMKEHIDKHIEKLKC